MPAVIDSPTAMQRVDRHVFLVRGWIWLENGHEELVGVEAWIGGKGVGSSGRLSLRPDVTHALRLADDAMTGFELVGRAPQLGRGCSFELEIRGRLRDGTHTDVLCRQTLATFGTDGPEDDVFSVPVRTSSCSPAVSAEFAPPPHLQIRQVAGVWGQSFYAEGRVIFRQIAHALAIGGQPLDRTRSILDFGCGCGRVLRGFEDLEHDAEIWGCDIDQEAIEWNRKHLSHIARFCANPTVPPTTFATGFFDAVYSVSVFTHLPEDLQFAWLTELRRILRPGGVLVSSVHGGHYSAKADAGVQEELARRGFAYRVGAKTDGLPDFYMAAYHSEAYIRTKWSRFFEIVAVREKFVHGVHDAVIMRRSND